VTTGPAFPIHFDGGCSAHGVRVGDQWELPAALAAVGLHPPCPVLVLVGGAGGLAASDIDRLRPALASGLVPVMQRLGAVAVDGGTRAGVMRLLGELRSQAGASFPLVAVAAVGTVRLPRERGVQDNRAELDPGHTHVVLVPGGTWGDEAPWLARTATLLAGGSPSLTLLVNGGEISYADVARSLDARRPVVAVAGSGRTADELAAALRGEPAPERAVALAATGLVDAVPADDPRRLADRVTAALSPPGRRAEPGRSAAQGG
jgi:hypothetical protein